jgi:hypothetical protein
MVKKYILITIFLILIPSLSFGEIYKWKDENGKTHFTDNLETVPSEYRKGGMGKIKEAPPLTGFRMQQNSEPLQKSEALRDYERVKSDNAKAEGAVKDLSCVKLCVSRLLKGSKGEEAYLKCGQKCRREHERRMGGLGVLDLSNKPIRLQAI